MEQKMREIRNNSEPNTPASRGPNALERSLYGLPADKNASIPSASELGNPKGFYKDGGRFHEAGGHYYVDLGSGPMPAKEYDDRFAEQQQRRKEMEGWWARRQALKWAGPEADERVREQQQRRREAGY
jgi:hypothetical protein